MRYKEVREIFWAQGARRRPLRLIVLAPTPDCKSPNGLTHYRAQAYILTTDLKRPAEVLIQCYLDHWQIEVSSRKAVIACTRNALDSPRAKLPTV